MADATKNPWYNALPFDYKELPPWMFGNTVMEPAAEMANLQAQELANAQRKITLEEAQQNEQARDAIAEALQAQDSFTYEQALPIMKQKFLEYGITDPAIKAAEEQARLKKDTQSNQRGIISAAVQLDNMMPGLGRQMLKKAVEEGEVTLPADFDWEAMKAKPYILQGGGFGEYYPEAHEFRTLRKPEPKSNKPSIHYGKNGEITVIDPETLQPETIREGEKKKIRYYNTADPTDFVELPEGEKPPIYYVDKPTLSALSAIGTARLGGVRFNAPNTNWKGKPRPDKANYADKASWKRDVEAWQKANE